ncbi:MAG TPA: SDR family NAD(P)-dependent oxidoreductase [Terrimesophilobacter sp.]|nr:SDR family NAD(P)-dependent oxidoreductase [Terrimesophilobacter sp.]HRP99532.1 SDR family NAD(P)-dependent oxidoreductase [Terrimesophilobacter sp.]
MRRNDVVVITGASSGIGRATAHEFAKRGAQLVLAARGAAALEDTAVECERLGARAIVVTADVSESGAADEIVDAALAEFGTIDVWVGAASVYAYGTFERTPPDVFHHIIETNLFGQVEAARAVLPVFRRQGAGTFIPIASVYGKTTAPNVSAYVASKWATIGFALSLSHELHGSGIAVCTVLPSTIDTPIHSHAANFTGENVNPIPPLVDPGRVARAIVRLTRRPRPVTVIGQSQRIFIPLQYLSARCYSFVIRSSWRLFALRGGTVTPHPGTVFDSDPQSNAVTGGWRSGWVRAGLALGALAAAAIALRSRETGPAR